jgi:hypothetical protein
MKHHPAMFESEQDFYDHLDHIEHADNLGQLNILYYEIHHISYRKISPCAEWYIERAPYLQRYDTLNWREFAEEFRGKNTQLHSTSLQIRARLDALLEEWSISSSFNLFQYAAVLTEIRQLWNHYETTYVGGETDRDILSIIKGLTHLGN